jgi:hypothetical protein
MHARTRGAPAPAHPGRKHSPIAAAKGHHRTVSSAPAGREVAECGRVVGHGLLDSEVTGVETPAVRACAQQHHALCAGRTVLRQTAHSRHTACAADTHHHSPGRRNMASRQPCMVRASSRWRLLRLHTTTHQRAGSRRRSGAAGTRMARLAQHSTAWLGSRWCAWVHIQQHARHVRARTQPAPQHTHAHNQTHLNEQHQRP